MSEPVDFDVEFDPPPPARTPPPAPRRAETHPADEEYHLPAKISPPRRDSYSRNGTTRELPHSPEAEEYLLSCCFLDGETVIAKCIEARIRRDSFYDTKYGLIYERLVDLHHRRVAIDISVVAEELKAARKLEQIGGYPTLVQITQRIPTQAQAGYFIDKVREQSLLREIIRSATASIEECHNFTGGVDEFLTEQQARLKHIATGASNDGLPAVPITDFHYPSGEDPSVLLGSDDYLGRGGGMLFVSHAGAGKSSWIMDACMSWALGMPWMGIRSNGPLKSLIIQAEDSPRYVGKVTSSFIHAKNLDLTQQATLGENCIMVRLKGVSGPGFFSELRRLTAKHKPDLVVLNPIYLYADGDISRSEFTQPFLVGLDEVNRDEKWGYVLVHHTGKPQVKDKNGARAKVEEWETVYMGFGSSYLANWPRCSALLEPVPDTNDRFVIKLGKAGRNAGVTREVQQGAGKRLEPATKIAIRHSSQTMQVDGRDRPVIFWEMDPEGATSEPAARTSNAGRKPTHEFSSYKNIFPPQSGPGLELNPLYKLLRQNREIPPKSLYSALERWSDDGLVEIIRPPGRPNRYRLAL